MSSLRALVACGRHRRSVIALLAVLIATLGCQPGPQPAPLPGWRLGWHAELARPATTSTTATCRFAVRLSASGSRVRLELADPAPGRGGGGFHIRSALVAVASGGRPLEAQSREQQATFGGAVDVTVRPHAGTTSDPVSLAVDAGQPLVVTLTVDAGDAPATVLAGEQTACATRGGPDVPDQPVRWLAGVQVDGVATRSVAGFGDSITEGLTLASGSYGRWTDRLTAGGASVVNGGSCGAALTRVGAFGTSAGLQRLPALLAEPGLTDVVLELGVNDLSEEVSAAQLLAGYDAALVQAAGHGVRLWVATVLPRSGSPWSASQEGQRRMVNTALRSNWLASRGGGLVDLDASLRDPADASRLLPAFDSGDHLHPSRAGALRAAATVGVALHLPAPR